MRIIDRLERRVINGCRNPTPLMTRYFLLRTRFGNLYLHRFHRSDEDRELHDHPWSFCSLILWPGYVEQTDAGRRRNWPGMILFRPARWRHRVEVLQGRESWSLVWVTPKCRDWGFWCADGWKSWREYHAAAGCAGETE